MKRYGQVIQLKPEKLEEYKRLHRAVWPEVLRIIRDCHIHNYSIFLRDGLLFSYFDPALLVALSVIIFFSWFTVVERMVYAWRHMRP